MPLPRRTITRHAYQWGSYWQVHGWPPWEWVYLLTQLQIWLHWLQRSLKLYAQSFLKPGCCYLFSRRTFRRKPDLWRSILGSIYYLMTTLFGWSAAFSPRNLQALRNSLFPRWWDDDRHPFDDSKALTEARRVSFCHDKIRIWLGLRISAPFTPSSGVYSPLGPHRHCEVVLGSRLTTWSSLDDEQISASSSPSDVSHHVWDILACSPVSPRPRATLMVINLAPGKILSAIVRGDHKMRSHPPSALRLVLFVTATIVSFFKV